MRWAGIGSVRRIPSLLGLAAAVCLLGASAPPAAAQAQPDAYRQALEFFRQSRYQRTIDLLSPALQTGGLGTQRASAWLLLAAAHLETDAPEPAVQALTGLDREFPDGPYLTERRWLLGLAHARAGRYLVAAREYAAVHSADPEGRLGIAARDALALLVTGPMSEADLLRLGVDLRGTDLKAWFVVEAAAALADRGDLGRARRLLERLSQEEPAGGWGGEVAGRLSDLTRRLTEAAPSGLVLGVLIPLTGPDAEPGLEIMNAVRLAVGEAGGEVRLVWRDTAGTLEGTVRGTLSLIRDEGAHVLLGPYFPELAIVAAGIAEGMDVPILLPFSQSSAPPTLGENVFQMQATSRIQARYLADAAVDSLGFRTFAVLNPLTGGGPDFAEAFMARVEEKGGSVLAHQVYFPQTVDFKAQLEAIRLQALRLSLADTGNLSLDDLAAVRAANRDTMAALVPVGSLDALVVPGLDPTDAVNIILQSTFMNLVTTVLGGPSWNSPEVVQRGQQYVEGVIFTDAYSVGYVAPVQVDFSNRYYATYGRAPARAATFAYDAANLALSAWRLNGSQAGDARGGIRDWLTGVERFEGASGPVGFTRTARVNDKVYLLQIREHRIQPFRR